MVREVRLAWTFSLAFWYCLYWALGEKGLVGQLGLVLGLDPVLGFMLSHCMLKDHDFEHLLSFRVGEFTLVDEGGDMGVWGMDALTGELAHI